MKDNKNQKMITAIDLFCGAGGCSEGLIQAGFHILFSSDISPMVEKTYRHRHEQLGLIQGENTWYERADIKDLTGEFIFNKISNLKIFKGKKVPEIDLIIGGPSCQGFSRAGKRDKNDPRNKLFGEYVRIISEIKPKYIVLENVEGFIDMQFIGYKGLTGKRYPDGSVTPDILRNELNEIGYETLEPKVLNAADFGVPQRRNRIIFIGYKKGVSKPSYPIPKYKPENYITLKEAIGDLIIDPKIRKRVNIEKSNYQQDSKKGRTPKTSGETIELNGNITCIELPKVSDIVKERFSLYKQGENSVELKKRIFLNGINIKSKPALLQLCKEEFKIPKEEIINNFLTAKVTNEQIEVLLTKKNIRQRWNEKQPASTVVTIADDYINPWEPRTFSVREMARCQSFDDSFEFLGKRTTGGLLRRTEIPQYTQVGNAVPPLLAKAVVEEIKKVLM